MEIGGKNNGLKICMGSINANVHGLLVLTFCMWNTWAYVLIGQGISIYIYIYVCILNVLYFYMCKYCIYCIFK